MSYLDNKFMQIWAEHRLSNLETDINYINKKIEIAVEALAELQNTKNQKNLEIRQVGRVLRNLRTPERLE